MTSHIANVERKRQQKCLEKHEILVCQSPRPVLGAIRCKLASEGLFDQSYNLAYIGLVRNFSIYMPLYNKIKKLEILLQ